MEVTVGRLLAKIGELVVALELANERIAELEKRQPAPPPDTAA
jgi:2-keto-4-pentenoate hydratase